MALISELWKSFRKYEEENKDPRIHGFLEESFLSNLAIIVIYAFLVTIAIPKFMAKRQPFSLKTPILIYNVGQIFISGAGCYILLKGISQDETSIFSCTPLDRTPSGDFLAKTLQALYYVRLIDLLETFFYALKKKDRQVSFLHVYHHMGNVFMGWFTMRYAPGGTSATVHGLNFGTHTIMYTYYLCTSHGYPKLKEFVAKKKHYMTRIQLVQLVLIIYASIDDILTPRCNSPNIAMGFSGIHVTFVLFLFLDFYYKNFIQQKPKQK